MLRLNKQLFTGISSALLTITLNGVGLVNNAHAQSSVTLYGVVDLGFAYQRNKAGTSPGVC